MVSVRHARKDSRAFNLARDSLCPVLMAAELLKQGARAGLTLYDIGSVLTRGYDRDGEEPSELERIAVVARRTLQLKVCGRDCFAKSRIEGSMGINADTWQLCSR